MGPIMLFLTVCAFLSIACFLLASLIVVSYILLVYITQTAGHDSLTDENIYKNDIVYIQTKETSLGDMSRLMFHKNNFDDVRVLLSDILNKQDEYEDKQNIWTWTKETDETVYKLLNKVNGTTLVFKRKKINNNDVVNHIKNAWKIIGLKLIIDYLISHTKRPSAEILRYPIVQFVAIIHKGIHNHPNYKSIIVDIERLYLVDKKKLH